MRLATRKLLDRAFSSVGALSILLMGACVLIILVPIFAKGVTAYVFRGTVEYRELMFEKFEHGNEAAVEAELAQVDRFRQPVYEMLDAFEENDLPAMQGARKREARMALGELEEYLDRLLGPRPGTHVPVLPRDQYGETRWHGAREVLGHILYVETWDYSDPSAMGTLVRKPRIEEFRGTALEPLFPYIEEHVDDMLNPRWTFYWRFLFDEALDAHFFGGIWPELLGTIYLTIGAMAFAVPLGIVSAVYLAEYAREGRLVGLLRTCISTLAGVPSIVFGLFGLAFFINTMHVSKSKSVVAGSLTLGMLVLPTVIRAAEEAVRAVPQSYKEAALGLGAGRWHTVMTVILPAALPGILTGIVISMGRAAGETAPIIFTAAVSVGRALNPLEAFSKPTPALSWNIYNIATEHEAVDEIRHVQFGMVMTLVTIVLLLNVTAIILRARISKKLKG